MGVRNIDRIRQMPLEKIAQLLVYETEEDDSDSDYYTPFMVSFWHSPSGKCFQDFGFDEREEAIADCVKWLDSEYLTDRTLVSCVNCEHFSEDDNGVPNTCFHKFECDFTDCKDEKPYSMRPKYKEYKNEEDKP